MSDTVTFNTSGSTGEAKAVVRTESSLAADAAALVAAFPEIWSQRPYVIATIPADHLYGALWRVRVPACAHAEVHPTTVVSVEELLAVTETHPRALLVTTPSFLEKALDHPDVPLLRERFLGIVTSGSLLRAETSEKARRILRCAPLEIYGSTETGSVAFRQRHPTVARHLFSTPLPETDEIFHLLPDVTATPAAEDTLAVDSPFAVTRPFVLADRVAFVTPRAFTLLGRADRRVKILETFVGLDAVAGAFAHHPLIADARCETYGAGVPRLGLVAVLSSEGCAVLARGSYAALNARLRTDLRPVTGNVAFPRRLRFVRALPVNERGKTTANALRTILDASVPEPAVAQYRATAEALSLQMTVPPDHPCFNGHFPGHPILPGVAQLFFVRHFAREVFPDFPAVATFRKLKFRQVIRPAKPVDLEVRRLSAGIFRASLADGSNVCMVTEIHPTETDAS